MIKILSWFIVTLTLFSAHYAGDNPESIYAVQPTESIGKIQDPVNNEGYRDIITYGDILIAVGSSGRIDRISFSGESVKPANSPVKTALNEAVANGKSVIAVGDKGSILTSDDGESFAEVKAGINADLNSVTHFDHFFIAGADSGILFLSNDGIAWSKLDLNLKGNIVSVSADDTRCAGVTDAGEIIISNDGMNWEIFDYNQTYKGFYKQCRFRKVLVAGKRIVVAGVHDDNTPAVLFSTMGKVWSERLLHFTDLNGMNGFLENLPNDIAYDQAEDQFLVACNNGEVISLPPCTKCNTLFRLGTANLFAVTYSGNIIAVAGSGYFFAKSALR